MDLIAALGQTFSHTSGVIAAVRPDQLDNPTPCAEWDLRALLGHTIGVVDNIGGAVRGEELRDPAAFTVTDAAAQFRAAADATLAAWTAAGLDGETNIGAGPMPKQAAISINLLDTAMHSWDIARATGQPAALPKDLATMVLGICKGFITDEVRGFAGFAPPVDVAADADPTTQLAAFLGRQP
jgi:uncharacterized protein (TIGR03086 family)